jgi:acyl carrier protein
MTNIQSTIINIINTKLDLDVPAEHVLPNSSLRDQLGMDSTEMVELIAAVEKALGRPLGEGAMNDWETVADFCSFVADRTQLAASA